MTEYRRARLPGASWFFTVNLAQRHGNQLLIEKIDVIRDAFRTVRARHLFRIAAVVIARLFALCVDVTARRRGFFYPLRFITSYGSGTGLTKIASLRYS